MPDSIGLLDERIKKAYPKAHKALFGNGDETRKELMAASLFIMTYECLKDFVESKFQGFFTDGFETRKDGAVADIFSSSWLDQKQKQEARYKELSKSLADIEMGRITLFQAGCAWFHEMEAITDDDLTQIIYLSKLRNELAHELYKWLFDDSAPQIESTIVNAPMGLYFKISRWWVKDIEASIAPEDYENYSEEDMSSAASLQAYILLQLIRKTLPEA